jgi:UDP-N-acetyl-D-glucosamine dehydrogenase
VFDVSEEKVNQVNNGISYISDLSLETLVPLIQRGQIRATTDYAILSELNIINICVPTPLSKSKNPDISFVLAAVESLVKHLHQGQLIILESTTYPGTTEEVVLPQLKEGGLKVGEDLFLAFSPERIDPGNEIYSIENTPKIVGGVTERCTEITKYFYSLFVNQIHPVSSPKVAETTKLLENTFRSVNIALINEFSQMCDKMELGKFVDQSNIDTPKGILQQLGRFGNFG